MKFHKGFRWGIKRPAISELMGTLLMVAITLVAGAAAFSWVNGQASTSEGLYGQNVASNANYLSEHFVIVNVQFTGCNVSPGYCAGLTVAVYNNGALPLTISSVSVANIGSRTVSNVCAPVLAVTSGAHSTNSTETPTSGSGCSPGTQTSATGAGFGLSPSTTPIPRNQVPPTTFSVAVGTSPGIVVGANYEVLVQGYYGSLVSVQVTASG